VLQLNPLPTSGVVQLDPARLFAITLEYDPFAGAP